MTEREGRRNAVVEIASTTLSISLLAAISIRRHLPSVTADGLVPVLISTYKWTPFYWGQDRLASLVPLLAAPVQDEIWNLKVQGMIMAFSFFALIAMFAWFHLHLSRTPRRRTTVAVTTLVAGLMVMLPMERQTGYTFILEQPYAPSMALFLSGCWLLVSPRTVNVAIGGTLVFLAMMLNPSSVLLTPVVLLLIEGRQQRTRRLAVATGTTLVAFVVTNGLMRVLYSGPTQTSLYNDFSVSRAIDGIKPATRMVGQSMWELVTTVIVVILVAVLAVLFGTFPRRLQVVYVAAPTFAVIWFVVFSGNLWVQINLYYYRYYFPLYATFMLVAAGVTAELVGRAQAAVAARTPERRSTSRGSNWAWAAAASFGIVGLVLAVRNIGMPTVDNSSALAELAVATDADLAVGNYWSVWPTVFSGRATGLDLLGVSDRSQAIEHELDDRIQRGLSDGSLIVLCFEPDAVRCADDMTDFTNRPWIAGRTIQASPLVIELVPDD